MSEIPDDIMKAARRRMLSMTSHSDLCITSAIANAILEERERCAKVAKERAFMLGLVAAHMSDNPEKKFCAEYAQTSTREVADKILKPEG